MRNTSACGILRRRRNKRELNYENAYRSSRSGYDARSGWVRGGTDHDDNDDAPDYYAGADGNTNLADNDTAGYGRRLRRPSLIASLSSAGLETALLSGNPENGTERIYSRFDHNVPLF